MSARISLTARSCRCTAAFQVARLRASYSALIDQLWFADRHRAVPGPTQHDSHRVSGDFRQQPERSVRLFGNGLGNDHFFRVRRQHAETHVHIDLEQPHGKHADGAQPGSCHCSRRPNHLGRIRLQPVVRHGEWAWHQPRRGPHASPASAADKLYGTPYLLQPTFAGFSSTSGTLTSYVSTDFVHPSQLELRDSSSGSSYSTISKSSGSQTTFTSSAASASPITRYLGLFVSDTNGGAVFTGADTATVTFTLVVP